MKKIRTLKANEIECRPQSVRDGKATLLLYIDSRAATDLLDETYDMENCTIEYKDVAGQIYGRLSVYDTETNRWVFREDTGSPANIEKEKSLASDIIKRCIVRLGVTELYSSPKIQIDDDGYGNTGYKVTEISYDSNRNITHLVIANRFNKEVFRWEKGSESTQYKPKSYTQTTQSNLEWTEDKKDNLTLLKEFYEQNKRNPNVNVEQLTKFKDYYKVKASDWRGDFNPSLMFERWMQRAA